VTGLLVTLEGIDGSGKSSVAAALRRELPRCLPEKSFIFTAEPTESDEGRILRAHLIQGYGEGDAARAMKMEELFLFLADHARHLAERVAPAMARGDVVVSDRYSDSTAAYQGVTLKEIVSDPLMWIRDISEPWNVKPDLTLLFVLPPELALERLEARPGKERFERLDFLKEVDQNFRRLKELEPDRFVLLDAVRPPELVESQALELITNLIEDST
jgi:dTMP kinase